MPIFIIMFRVLHGLTSRGSDGTFDPDYISKSSELYSSLDNKTEMLTWGLDLSLRPIEVLQDDPGKGVVYALLVVALMGLYYAQQRMIASRTVSPTMSATQAKIMQYLPVVFGVFQIFFPVGLVIYYFSQTIVRIAQQAYITRRFYKGDESLGRQAQEASAKARDMAKKDGGGGGLFGQLKQEAAKAKQEQASNRPTSKRVTPPKGSASAKGGSSGTKGRPTPSNRPKPGGKPRHPKPPRP
jgi:YidC/Oxa1 family membrane protein insertase